MDPNFARLSACLAPTSPVDRWLLTGQGKAVDAAAFEAAMAEQRDRSRRAQRAAKEAGGAVVLALQVALVNTAACATACPFPAAMRSEV